MSQRFAPVLLLALASALACDDPTEAGPRAVHVAVTPADTLLAPGDSAAFEATALGENEQPLEGLSFAWSSSDTARVRIGQDGRALAVAPGDATLTATSPGGTRGFAEVRVRNVTSIEPSHGPFGTLVRIDGAGFGDQPRVRFGGVQAFVADVAEDGRSFEAWVPLGAETGPVTVIAGGQTFAAAASFFVTGLGDDALEPNGFGAPHAVELPFRNPALVVRPPVDTLDADVYRFTLPQPAPVGVRLTDRSGILTLGRATRLELLDVARQDLVGLVASVGARGGPFTFQPEPLLPVEIAAAMLPAGTYEVLVTPFSFTGSLLAAGTRGYGLRIDGSPVFALPPDAAEPNENPGQAPVLPFPSTHELALENPWAADYFLFDVAEATDVTVSVQPLSESQTRLNLWLMSAPAKSIPWIDATGEFPDLYLPALVSADRIEVGTTLQPGRYVVAVLDGIGAPTPYRLELAEGAVGALRGVANGPGERQLLRLRASTSPVTPEGE